MVTEKYVINRIEEMDKNHSSMVSLAFYNTREEALKALADLARVLNTEVKHRVDEQGLLDDPDIWCTYCVDFTGAEYYLSIDMLDENGCSDNEFGF